MTTIVNRRKGGNLMKLCSDAELESMKESDDIDTQLAAEEELKRRNGETDEEMTWDEANDVW